MTTEPNALEPEIDGGFSASSIELAELVWANIPTGRPWTSLSTHEKALVIHQIHSLSTRSALPASDELREKVARIIDPGSWSVMDGYKADMLRKYRGKNIGWPADQYQHKESMAKAAEILAALSSIPADPVMEQMAQALDSALDGLSQHSVPIVRRLAITRIKAALSAYRGK